MADISGKDLAYRALASAIGGPVDLVTMAMRPFGYKVEKPVLGSEWIGQKIQDTGLISEARDPLKEFTASVMVPSPGGIAAGLGKASAMIPVIAGTTKLGNTIDALNQTSTLDRMMKTSKGGLINDPTVVSRPSGYTTQSGFTRSDLESITHWVQDYGREPKTLDYDAFYEIQKYLRTGETKYTPSEIGSVIDTLKQKILSTNATKSFTVYRGVGNLNLREIFGVDKIDDLKIGQTGQTKAFFATSSDKRTASGFAHDESSPQGVIYKVKVNPGDKTLDLTDFNFDSEKEFLFAPGTNFKVSKIEKLAGHLPTVTLVIDK